MEKTEEDLCREDLEREFNQKLAGGIIDGVMLSPGAYPYQFAIGISIRFSDGRRQFITVLQDPEGNGPGWISLARP